jgi:hypothetical protein
MDDYRGCIEWSSRLAVIPVPQHQIIGMLFKGCALYLLGSRTEAGEQFQILGNHLIPMGSPILQQFSWDFRDSEKTLAKVNLASASLLIAVLNRQMPFPEFVSRWAAMFPAQAAQPAH